MKPKHHRLVSAKKGLLPGTAVYVGENPPRSTQVKTHIYSSESYRTQEGFHPAEIHEAIKQGFHVWLDICGLENIDLIAALGKDFNIHPLIIEDLLNTHQRPKLDVIEDYRYIVVKLLNGQIRHHTYGSEQFSLIIKQNLLITARESSDYDFHGLYKRLASEHSLVREHGSDYLMYLIIDTIIDDYFHFVEETAKQLETLEEFLIHNPEELKLSDLYSVKRRTITMRTTLTPLRDVIHLLMTDQGHLTSHKYHLYYRDLYDHCLRLVEQIDLNREMTTSMLDIYLSSQNNRMNETMKILTMFASIFIPLSFIASVYGMNFRYMPELDYRYAYPLVILGMGCLVGVMLYYFKKKKLF